MFKQDWFMRQVEDMVSFLTTIVLNKDNPNYEISKDQTSLETDILYGQLTELINSQKVDEAENLLFEKIDKDNNRYLELATDFYARLNKLNDDTLDKCGFSREEIEEGLKDIADIFGITTI